jgi:hypothetical protein
MKAKAEKATPGPWLNWPLWDRSGLVPNKVTQAAVPGRRWKADTEEICRLPCDPLNIPNAEFIAACDPQTIKALVEIALAAQYLMKNYDEYSLELPAMWDRLDRALLAVETGEGT